MTATSPDNITRIMLVDDHIERSAVVEQALNGAGFSVIAVLPSANGLLYQIAQHQPDVVLIDLQSPGRDVLESLALANQHNPRPVVMFSTEDDAEFIREAVDAGVSGYFMEGFNPARVKPVIDLAIAQFKAYQHLRHERDHARDALASQSVVMQAKQLLMSQRHINEASAHKALQKLAMDTNQSLPQAAQALINLLQPTNDRRNSP